MSFIRPVAAFVLLLAVSTACWGEADAPDTTQGAIADARLFDRAEPASLRLKSPSQPPPQSFWQQMWRPTRGPSLTRLALWEGLALTQGYVAYRKATELWGDARGKFHFKDELQGDYLAFSDEVSHLLIAYKLTQLAHTGYRWSGLSADAAARTGAIHAALYMAFVEFPMDAYNPEQGFGLTDLVADFLGVGLAWFRAGQTNPRWDFKVSVKPQFFSGKDRVLAQNMSEYDDYIYWLTWRISDNRYNPIVLGLGYSTHHPPGAFAGDVPIDRQFYFHLGTSPAEIGRFLGKPFDKLLKPAEVYFLGVGPKTEWR